jgi:hypothetical protein
MKLITLLFFIPILAFSQQLEISNYNYSTDGCSDKFISESKISKILIDQDSLYLEFKLIYPNCHLFNPSNLFLKGDSLILNFDTIIDEQCFCGELAIYSFQLKTRLIVNIPTQLILTNNNRVISSANYSNKPFLTKKDTKHLLIDDYIFNQIDILGRKQGIWITIPTGQSLKFDSVTYYVNNILIKTIQKSEKDFNISSKTITAFLNNNKRQVVEYMDEYKISTYYSIDESITISDSRFDKKGFDRVLKEIDGSPQKVCWLYIKGKRVVKRDCE